MDAIFQKRWTTGCHLSSRAWQHQCSATTAVPCWPASARAAHAAGESRCQHDCRNAWQSVNGMSSNTFPCKTQGFRKVTTRLPDCLAICQSKARQPVNRMPGNPSTACLSSTNLLLDRQGLNAVRDALVSEPVSVPECPTLRHSIIP